MVIAAVALAVSVGSAAISFYSASIQKGDQADNRAALAEVKSQFIASGPNYSVKANLDVYDSKKIKWRAPQQTGTVLPYEDLQPPNQLYINVYVTNTGRALGSITDVGVMTNAKTPLPGQEVYCDGIKVTDRIALCDLPMPLEAQRTVHLYLKVTDELRTALTCNPYAQNGIIAFTRASDEKLAQKNTGAGIAYSTYCVTLPKPTP